MPTSTPVKSLPRQNHLLAALPPEALERLSIHMEWVPLGLGQVLYEPGTTIRHVWFPTTAALSLIQTMAQGATCQVAMVGREGMVGNAVFLEGGLVVDQAVVHCAGQGYRLRAGLLMEEFQLGGLMQRLLLRQTQLLQAQTAQTAACNRHHSLDQQFCCWLIHTLDRCDANPLIITQELAGNLLGVRREGISAAAARMQKAGLIRYLRGRLKVLDRAGLEARACECYGVVKGLADRLLEAFPAADST